MKKKKKKKKKKISRDFSVKMLCTVWKFQNSSITQILREINFGITRDAKSVIVTHLEALRFEFFVILHFLKENRNYVPNQHHQEHLKLQKGSFRTCRNSKN